MSHNQKLVEGYLKNEALIATVDTFVSSSFLKGDKSEQPPGISP